MNTIWNEISERYEITNEMITSLEDTRIMGHAFKKCTDDFYKVKLRILPFNAYYLKQDTGSELYTLYAKSNIKVGNMRLYDPIGLGYKTSSGSYIRVSVPDLELYFYIRLSPKDYHHDLKVS